MDKRLAAERTRMYKVLAESHPLYFGDPLKLMEGPAFSGTAYGEYEKSGGGFLGAIVSVVAAVATGGASLGFTTLASTLMTVSLGATVVGAITGNETISKIGSVLGLAGGVASLATKGVLGETAKGWAGSAEGMFKEATGSAAKAIGSTVVDAGEALNAAQSAPVTPDTLGVITPDAAGAPPATKGLMASPSPSPMGDAGGAGLRASTQSSFPMGDAGGTGVGPIRPKVDAPAGEEGFFSGMLKLANNNKGLTQIGADAVKGLLTPEKEVTEEEKRALDSRSSYYDAQTAQTLSTTALQKQAEANASAQPTVNPMIEQKFNLRQRGLISTVRQPVTQQAR